MEGINRRLRRRRDRQTSVGLGHQCRSHHRQRQCPGAVKPSGRAIEG
jgi:hypothetical protein